MKFLDSDERYYRKARKRLGRLPLPQVQDWGSSTLWGIQEALEQAPDRAALATARQGTAALLAVIDTLLDNDIG